MNNQELNQLAQIYNTLMTISTKGQDTVVMGQCLYAMQELIQSIDKRLRDEATRQADKSESADAKTKE